MCDKAFNVYTSEIQFVSKCYKPQEKCDQAFDTCPFVFDSIHDRYKT